MFFPSSMQKKLVLKTCNSSGSSAYPQPGKLTGKGRDQCPDYWEHAEKILRQQLCSAAPLTNVGWLMRRIPASRCGAWITALLWRAENPTMRSFTWRFDAKWRHLSLRQNCDTAAKFRQTVKTLIKKPDSIAVRSAENVQSIAEDPLKGIDSVSIWQYADALRPVSRSDKIG